MDASFKQFAKIFFETEAHRGTCGKTAENNFVGRTRSDVCHVQ